MHPQMWGQRPISVTVDFGRAVIVHLKLMKHIVSDWPVECISQTRIIFSTCTSADFGFIYFEAILIAT